MTCDLCRRANATRRITIVEVVADANKPLPPAWVIHTCERCLPFECVKQETVAEKVMKTRRVR